MVADGQGERGQGCGVEGFLECGGAMWTVIESSVNLISCSTETFWVSSQ